MCTQNTQEETILSYGRQVELDCTTVNYEGISRLLCEKLRHGNFWHAYGDDFRSR